MPRTASFYDPRRASSQDSIRSEVLSSPKSALIRALLEGGGDTRPAHGGWGEGIARALEGIAGGWMAGKQERQVKAREQEAKETITRALMGDQVNEAAGPPRDLGGGVSSVPLSRTPNTQADMARILAGNPDTAGMGFQMQMAEMERERALQGQLAAEKRAQATWEQRFAAERGGREKLARMKSAGGSAAEYGFSPLYYRMPDGSVGVAQLAKGGGARPVEGLPEGAQIIKPAERIGGTLYDPLSAQPRADVTEDLSKGKAAEKSGELTASELFSRREVAQGAARSLQANMEARKLLEEGVITGSGAGFITGFGKMLQQVGLAESSDAIANTEAFTAARAQEVAQIIKQFGAGTGLSDKDREFAEKAAAGQVSMTRESIKRILDLNDRASRNIIKLYNKDAEGFEKTGKLPLAVEVPEGLEGGIDDKDEALLRKYGIQ